MVSFVNTAPTAPTVVLVLPLVTCRARVAMTAPVVESWEKRGGRGGGRRKGNHCTDQPININQSIITCLTCIKQQVSVATLLS